MLSPAWIYRVLPLGPVRNVPRLELAEPTVTAPAALGEEAPPPLD